MSPSWVEGFREKRQFRSRDSRYARRMSRKEVIGKAQGNPSLLQGMISITDRAVDSAVSLPRIMIDAGQGKPCCGRFCLVLDESGTGYTKDS